MGVALYIVTQQDVDFDTFVDGKAVGRLEHELLEAACATAGVPSLLTFLSENPEELADFLDEEGIEPDTELDIPQERWFQPAAGLLAVRGLLAHLREHPGSLPLQAAVIDDLEDYERVLTRLQVLDMPWHFAIDI